MNKLEKRTKRVRWLCCVVSVSFCTSKLGDDFYGDLQNERDVPGPLFFSTESFATLINNIYGPC